MTKMIRSRLGIALIALAVVLLGGSLEMQRPAHAAVGDVTTIIGADSKAIELLAATVATNGQPSGASAGLDLHEVSTLFGGFFPDQVTLVVESTAGSGTMTVTCRLWGYLPFNSGKWVPLGTGADTTKGTINDGSAIGETIADGIRHAEPVNLAGHFSRLYLEVTAIGGTSTSVTAWIVARRNYPR